MPTSSKAYQPDKGVTVTNRTEYDTKEVRNLVRRTLRTFEATHAVSVTVHHTRKRDGYTRGWYRNYWYPSKGEDRPQIRVALPRPEDGLKPYVPYLRTREQGRIFEMHDWREALIAVTAHEATHHRQGYRRNGKGGFREVDCDLAAYRAVMYYRDGTL